MSDTLEITTLKYLPPNEADKPSSEKLDQVLETAVYKTSTLLEHMGKTNSLRDRFFEDFDSLVDSVNKFGTTLEDEDSTNYLNNFNNFKNAKREERNRTPFDTIMESTPKILVDYKNPDYLFNVNQIEESLNYEQQQSYGIEELDRDEFDSTLKQLHTMNEMLDECPLRETVREIIAEIEGPQRTRLGAVSVFYRQHIPEEIGNLRRLVLEIKETTN